jgi:hypothetical protein
VVPYGGTTRGLDNLNPPAGSPIDNRFPSFSRCKTRLQSEWVTGCRLRTDAGVSLVWSWSCGRLMRMYNICMLSCRSKPGQPAPSKLDYRPGARRAVPSLSRSLLSTQLFAYSTRPSPISTYLGPQWHVLSPSMLKVMHGLNISFNKSTSASFCAVMLGNPPDAAIITEHGSWKQAAAAPVTKDEVLH